MDPKPISDLFQSEPNDQFEADDLVLGGFVLELFVLVRLLSGFLVPVLVLLIDDLSLGSLQLLDKIFLQRTRALVFATTESELSLHQTTEQETGGAFRLQISEFVLHHFEA